jgi:hypothetical protein
MNRETTIKRASTIHWIASSLVVLLLLGCSGGVSLTNVWSDPGYVGQPKKSVLVVGVTPRPESRSNFEYQLKYDLIAHGVNAIASVDGLPKDVKLDKESFAQYFGDKNLDAVLITSLVSADTTEEYVPGMTYTAPIGYGGYGGYGPGWYGYYRNVYSVYQDPGYWTENSKFVLETNLFDVATTKLIWRGMSEAVNPDDAVQLIGELSKKLVKRLAKDGMLTGQPGY